jgi:hypothetical protein
MQQTFGIPRIIAPIKIELMRGMVVHACNPSTLEAETGGSRVLASLVCVMRLCVNQNIA